MFFFKHNKKKQKMQLSLNCNKIDYFIEKTSFKEIKANSNFLLV